MEADVDDRAQPLLQEMPCRQIMPDTISYNGVPCRRIMLVTISYSVAINAKEKGIHDTSGHQWPVTQERFDRWRHLLEPLPPAPSAARWIHMAVDDCTSTDAVPEYDADWCDVKLLDEQPPKRVPVW